MLGDFRANVLKLSNKIIRLQMNTELGPCFYVLEQLRQLDIYRSRTSDRGLSSSNSLLFSSEIILKQLFASVRLGEYCRIIPSTSSRGLFDNIHLAFGE